MGLEEKIINPKMNRKALQLAITNLVLLVIGIAVLIGLVYALTDGFKKFQSATDPFTDMAQANAVTQTCKDACQNNVKIIYCCSEYGMDGETI